MKQRDGIFPPERIYLATSWRNLMQPSVVKKLEDAGYIVYDFRNPHGNQGFAWKQLALEVDCGDHGEEWYPDRSTPGQLLEALKHPEAVRGYETDFTALMEADIVVLLLPCERDAHLELGWAVGTGKETYVVLDNPCKASLMYQMVDHVVANVDELLRHLHG